jgi:hypothetical protein
VVNNSFVVPTDVLQRTFNSYNAPSVNVDRLVVFRGRTRGGPGGEPDHGVFVRDMALHAPVATVLDRSRLVPQPNNLSARFTEPPSFPRIDLSSSTIASRGNHPPAWRAVLADGTEMRAGTTGIYADPLGTLVTGESNLGGLPEFASFAVPGASVKFDVFPGAPAVTDGATIVFKGNYTLGAVTKTGVYYRDLAGSGAAVVLADTNRTIPGSATKFGSVAPPSAVGRQAVFAGFDDESAPSVGGIYLAPLTGTFPPLTRLVAIGAKVPGQVGSTFATLGDAISFDGRFVAFWGAWGDETRTLTLACPTEGNAVRNLFCRTQYPSGFTTIVPVHQGIFVHDTRTRQTRAVVTAPADVDDFLYWSFSGFVPGSGEADDTGEPARFRSTAFVAVSSRVGGNAKDTTFATAFKARAGDVNGIYLRRGPGPSPIAAVVESGTDGTSIDPAAEVTDEATGAATPLAVTEMVVERDGFRRDALVVTVRFGTEEAGWAGIYLATVPQTLDAR